MSKKIISLSTLLGMLLFVVSCKDATKVEYFNVSIIFAQDLHLEKGASLDNNIKLLLNYQRFDSCINTLYVPQVTIIRADILSNSELLSPPLSWLNSWKPVSWVPAKNLIDDYDKNISEIKNPEIAFAKSDSVISVEKLIREYPNLILINYNENSSYMIDESLTSIILPNLCKGVNKDFYFLFYKKETPKIDTFIEHPGKPTTEIINNNKRIPISSSTEATNKNYSPSILSGRQIMTEISSYENKLLKIDEMLKNIPLGVDRDAIVEDYKTAMYFLSYAKSHRQKLNNVTIKLINNIESNVKEINLKQ